MTRGTKLLILLVGMLILASGPSAGSPKSQKHKPARYRESGSILVGNSADLLGYGITRNDFQRVCDIPTTQGIDGHVIRLPDSFSKIKARVKVIGTDVTTFYDLDMYFYDDACGEMGSAATETVPEVGAISPGTAFVVISSTHGAAVEFTFSAKEMADAAW